MLWDPCVVSSSSFRYKGSVNPLMLFISSSLVFATRSLYVLHATHQITDAPSCLLFRTPRV